MATRTYRVTARETKRTEYGTETVFGFGADVPNFANFEVTADGFADLREQAETAARAFATDRGYATVILTFYVADGKRKPNGFDREFGFQVLDIAPEDVEESEHDPEAQRVADEMLDDIRGK